MVTRTSHCEGAKRPWQSGRCGSGTGSPRGLRPLAMTPMFTGPSYPSPLTSYLSPLTSHLLPLTSYLSPLYPVM
jgi:hypothetical protein